MSEKHPPVSIYITTYLNSAKRGEVLKATCENALAQNYPDFEVVVSDNAGTYPAEQALAEINDPRLRVVRQTKNLGQVGNSNACVDHCRHELIKVQCDDDLLHPDCLRLSVPHVDDETYVVVDKVFYTIGAPPAALREPTPPELPVEIRQPGYRSDIWNFMHVSLPGCCLFTRKLFEGLGSYDDQTVLFDYDFLLEARLRKRVAFVRYPLCYMGEWSDSFSSQMLRDKPYFFSIEALYTKFRVLKGPCLNRSDRALLRARLLKEFGWEALRVPAHFWLARYWSGFVGYARRFMELVFTRAENFTPRPSSAEAP